MTETRAHGKFFLERQLEKVSQRLIRCYMSFFPFPWWDLKFIPHSLLKKRRRGRSLHLIALYVPPKKESAWKQKGRLSYVVWTKIWKCEKRAAAGGFQTLEQRLQASFAVGRVKSCFLSFPILSLPGPTSCYFLHQLLFSPPLQADGARALIILLPFPLLPTQF